MSRFGGSACLLGARRPRLLLSEKLVVPVPVILTNVLQKIQKKKDRPILSQKRPILRQNRPTLSQNRPINESKEPYIYIYIYIYIFQSMSPPPQPS